MFKTVILIIYLILLILSSSNYYLIPELQANCKPPTLMLNTPEINGTIVTINGITLPGGSNYSITSITWSWGDGNVSTSWFTATHAYSENGTYTIVATTHQSDGQNASASVTVTLTSPYYNPISKASPPVIQPDAEPSNKYPISLQYSPYRGVQPNQYIQIYQSVPNGPLGLSFGVYNGTLDVTIYQGSVLLYNGSIEGPPFNYIVTSRTLSYSYVDFVSNGQQLKIILNNPGSTVALFAYNLYNAPITNFTASLITLPPQFAVNIGPSTTPPNNTGMSLILKAPIYPGPDPFAIWIGEGFYNSTNFWWAQVGFNDWYEKYDNISHAGWGIFSNYFGSPGGTDFNYPLVPGDIYNFTMAYVGNGDWAFLVNGTPIIEPGLPGYIHTGTTYANGGEDFGIETLTAFTSSYNITNLVEVPSMMLFKVNGTWVEPNGLDFIVNGIGENWWNGNATSASSIPFWGIEGHLQNQSIPTDSLLIQDGLSAVVATPAEGFYPLYGTYQAPGFIPYVGGSNYGPTLVKVRVVNGTLSLYSLTRTYVSVAFINSNGIILQQLSLRLHANSTATVTIPSLSETDKNGNGVYGVMIYASTLYLTGTQKLYNQQIYIPLHVPPTIKLNGNVFNPGEKLLLSGKAIPDSEVDIKLINPYGETVIEKLVNTSPSGLYNTTLISFPLSLNSTFPYGTYKIEVNDGLVSSYTNISFEPLMYALTFVEQGLPQNSMWSVTLNGSTRTTNSSSITFYVTKGDYYYLVSNVSYSTNYTVGYTPQVQKGYIELDNNSTVRVLFIPLLFKPILNLSFLSNGSVVKRLIQDNNYTLQIITKNLGNASENVELTISITLNAKYMLNGVEYNFTLSQNGVKLVKLPIKFNMSGNMALNVSLNWLNSEGKVTFVSAFMQETIYTEENNQTNTSITQTNTHTNTTTSTTISSSTDLTSQTNSSTFQGSHSKTFSYNIYIIGVALVVVIVLLIALLLRRR
ncbi:PKD domain-containing protein [Sulfolobus acidocaldarius]|uniref:Membrane protein n=4 Tax=Sulfolobus acidocaldarius TaxID=2285 RepID=Q4J7S2_SULAC|nr:PKD domain-containing protein [Sulfolobus acidocaldarius]AAY81159.1 membrane protein [Sulfolobus acidocaldarius DSM 639]AGE71771.1 membrane protein [Sulfolobus acidocaldarius N8]AGE74044.1 membrane protein [Sulfolobus acidocaldarius Ron12/I]ALU30029.1 hypothetical protein ATY89_08845 [Sulfolobus acidocaldarius]ALU30719.1 hypothetical protein ATZ20_00255 [Sulfolobus acidocaldarius]